MSGETPENAESPSQEGPASETSRKDPFTLEKVYPDAAEVFAQYKEPEPGDASVVVVPDTNALLLPYKMKHVNLEALKKVYKKLAAEDRLVVPSRVAREFAKHRDRHLGDLVEALNKRKINLPTKEMPPMLEGLTGFNEVQGAHAKMESAFKEYKRALDELIKVMKTWRGNDPVGAMYASVFKTVPIVDQLPLDEASQANYLAELRWRFANDVPPGYADRTKDDLGVGDFLIWKSILALAEQTKKNLIFVTGEESRDWFVQTGGAAIFPRLELIVEYRRASGGKAFRLMRLHELLRQLKVAPSVVEDVKKVEDQDAAETLARRAPVLLWRTSDGRLLTEEDMINLFPPGRFRMKLGPNASWLFWDVENPEDVVQIFPPSITPPRGEKSPFNRPPPTPRQDS